MATSNYRIVTNGIDYKIEYRVKLKFWQSVPRWKIALYWDRFSLRPYRKAEFVSHAEACRVLATLEEADRLKAIRDKNEWKEVTCRTISSPE